MNRWIFRDVLKLELQKTEPEIEKGYGPKVLSLAAYLSFAQWPAFLYSIVQQWPKPLIKFKYWVNVIYAYLFEDDVVGSTFGACLFLHEGPRRSRLRGGL